jgi:RNA polymerase sigma factor (TIGR02999 family)
MRPVETPVSTLITSAEGGDSSAADALFAALYAELHRMAQGQLGRGGGGVTLGATSLLHEAYLDISQREGVAFPDRARFMAYAACVMRGLIVDFARRRRARKRGGGFELTALGSDVEDPAAEPSELIQIGEAVEGLAAVEPELAQVVDLKFFSGFSCAEIAHMRGVSERTVQRHWEKARLYLHQWIRDEEPA